MRLAELLDLAVLRKLTEANYRATGMPIGVVDAADGEILIGVGWQEICSLYHRVHPVSAARCRESDDYIKSQLPTRGPTEYRCRNGLRDVGIPIVVAGEHSGTVFMGQFFYEGEVPDREFYVRQARELGFDEAAYLRALDRVPVFTRAAIDDILIYNQALAQVVGDLAEGALRRREAEARASALARFPEENPEPVLRIASDGTLVYANPAAREALGGDAVPGRPAPEELAAPAREALRTRAPGRLELRRGDATFLLSLVPVGEPGADRGEVNVYGHDITARKQAETALAEESRRKDEFLAMMSHELRNPLAPIQNSLALLDRPDLPADRAEHARDVAKRQLGHLSRLVDELLDVSRIRSGAIELRRVPVDLCASARQAEADFGGFLRERGISLALELPPGPVWVEGDPVRLAQVLGNLLHNAAKFTPSGGHVALSAAGGGGRATLRVTDDGRGIDPRLLPHVFDTFVQARQSLARTEGGLGLGLAIVRGLVELHGGTVSAASGGLGRGAAFTVSLPLAARAPAPAPGASQGDAAVAARPRHVLVVDDNRDAADSLAELVEMLGHHVDVAYHGRQAIELIRTATPDVVLCDIGMPEVNGYDVARAARSLRGDGLELVAVTGYVSAEDVDRAKAAGFDAHVPKPPDPRRIERLLAHPEAGWRGSAGAAS